MKNLVLLAIGLIGLTLFSSCGEGDDITFNFKLEYEDQPLVLFEDYTYPSGEQFQIQRVSFFISDLTLQSAEHGDILLSEVEYIDLTNSHVSQAVAEEGFELALDGTGIESYEGLSFNIGLSPDVNSSVPEDYVSSNPLSNSAEYWRSWNSYIFIKLEGKMDIDADGAYGSGESFQLHIGSNAAMRSFSTVKSSDDNNIIISVDDIFSHDDNTSDLATNPRLHVLDDETIRNMGFLATGLEQAIRVD